ncbi:unnamed protein product [Didymodactylos carnosus]|uniref:Uncharacterized protein n=2 Tax=Didymodactylos carnosus TaxID=1234261 RepID=A0A814DH23_9BILA|nr:unnamed protein product [Didymodactylos carnosus]CAF3730693.1 unnamed protein product [Didymodactylos carnosus]
MPADSPNCTLDKFTTSPSTVNMTTIVTPAILLSNGTTKGSLLPTPQLTRSTSPRLETRQLNKLRRFLSTLYHFGSDISSEIGERVKTLILSIVNNAVSVEEFHAKVQQITNFPLRPFALPFLKTTLPLLQKDILYMARQAKQSTAQFISQREDLIFLPREISEISTKDFNENGKRKLNDDLRELDDKQYPSKHSSTACTSPPLMHPNLSLKNNSFYSTITTSTTNSYSTSSSNRLVDTMRRDFKDKERSFTAYLREYASDFKDITDKTMDDDWKNAESMLNCVLDMVTKAKRALFILQQKDTHLRRLVETNDLEWRRRHSELLTQTEDRIMEVRRKAEETVIEIKRQGLIDIQKAVSNSEQKSSELLTCEREQFQRITQEVKQKSFEDAYTLLNIQEDGPEQCWHCGRKAIETCSGCSVARYCGLFCQHRDWSLHQKLCGPDLKQKLTENLLCGGTRRAYKIQTSTISPNNNNHQHMQNNVTTTTSDLPPSIKTSSTPVLIETSHSTCTTPLLYVSSPPTDEPEHTSTLDTTINHQQHDSNALNITTTTSVVKTEVFEEQNVIPLCHRLPSALFNGLTAGVAIYHTQKVIEWIIYRSREFSTWTFFDMHHELYSHLVYTSHKTVNLIENKQIFSPSTTLYVKLTDNFHLQLDIIKHYLFLDILVFLVNELSSNYDSHCLIVKIIITHLYGYIIFVFLLFNYDCVKTILVLIFNRRLDTIPELFRSPYLATSPKNFWKRWHQMYRNTWLHIIYIPISTLIRQLHPTSTKLIYFGLPAMAVFLFSGIIHEYIVYGAFQIITGEQLLFFTMQGIAVNIEHVLVKKCNVTMPNWLGFLLTFLFNGITGIYFVRPWVKSLRLIKMKFSIIDAVYHGFLQ